ncbi:MAG: hypothetical protein Q7R56_03285 [Nanoarchaeota archaeon]|nr:hypothetical protein [Nanoarchaeota archaeon]
MDPEGYINRNRKGLRIILTFLLILMLISFLFSGRFEASWPYFIMLLLLFILFSIKARKTYVYFGILFLALLFLMQVSFYFVIPLTHNYQPTPAIPNMMSMFQLYGKFQISYYPDIPKGGDIVNLFLDVCDVSMKNCIKCVNCTLKGTFIDEKKEERELFYELLNNKSNILFQYPGRKVKININFTGVDPRYDSFYIPRLTWYQSILVMFEESLFFRWVSIISLIIFIVVLPFNITQFYRYLQKILR